ncbi:MAG: RNA recognition motif domain-containing protein [Hyphomicrobiales bacterium]|jgi:hypothetical protein
MSTFETKLYALCVDEAERTHGVSESATLTHVMTAALATTIAALTKGDPVASSTITALAIEGVPDMVTRRAHLFRHGSAQ